MSDRPAADLPGVKLIAAERCRQVEVEGYTAEHDAGHSNALALAAACYATPDRYRHCLGGPPPGWPWEEIYWKPCPDDRVRELIKAGALVAAEIDRILAQGDSDA